MPTSVTTRTRALVPWWVLLCLLAFVQSPGRTVADTKHDLTVDPLRFLSNATTMWSDNLTFGQLQNQAYGYLFPQGPFFVFFDFLPDWLAPDWLAQALWWTLTLCLAFTGFFRVAETIGVGSYWPRIIAALLYAFSPRIITTLGAISSEAWPVALAPWILLPLLRVVATRADVNPRGLIRAVALSGLAVLSTGAVNAVSTAAACIPAGLVLLSAALFGPRRRRAWVLLSSWLVTCALVSLWWIIPLLQLGKYAAPFTDYIESSGVTTRWMNLAEVIRGTTSWTPFVSIERVGGNALVGQPVLIYATIAVAAIGLLGLAMRAMPLRRLWLSMLLIGVIIMAGWTEPFSPVWSSAQELLDSTLAALRNLHKFDTIVRLPLLLGFAHAIAMLPWPVPGAGGVGKHRAKHRLIARSVDADHVREAWLHPEKQPKAIAAMLVMVIALAATAPAWSARLAPSGGYKEVPKYWTEAANWINNNSNGSRTLLLPSAPFGNQTWGNTRDEPIQPLAEVPWAVRDAIPLVPPEAIRALDGLCNSLNSGRAVPALDQTLRANGIGYVLVRYDLADTWRADPLSKVSKTLHDSAGMEKVAEFADDEGRNAIAIYGAGPAELRNQAMLPRIMDTSQIPLVAGGPEVLARLNEVDGDTPVRNLSGANAGTITDTPARRGRNYGEVVNAESGILADGEDTHVENLVPDYPVAGIPLTQTATGGTKIEVTSSASEPYNVGGAASEHSVNAMLDGDPTSWWEPLRGTGQAEKITLTPERPLNGGMLTLTVAKATVQVRVATDRASQSVQLQPGKPTRVALPSGSTSKIVITATVAPLGFAISELRLEGSAGSGEDPNSTNREDLTPIRVPVVPDSSPLAERWVFGQEIDESTLVRVFTVPGPRTVRVDADTCRTNLQQTWAFLERADGSERHDLNCGEEIELGAGAWRLQAKSTWVSLTDRAYFAPNSAQQNVGTVEFGGELQASESDRVLWVPSSVNAGRELSVGGVAMQPVTINGWQQGWSIPAGTAGVISYTYGPGEAWRGGIVVGGIVAAVMALISLAIVIAWRDWRPPSQIARDELANDLARTVMAVIAVAATVLTSGLPGLGVAVGVSVLFALALWRLRPRSVHRGAIVALALVMVAGGWALASAPWPDSDYAGAGWLLQLLMVAALVITAASNYLFTHTRPKKRRAGSSTKA